MIYSYSGIADYQLCPRLFKRKYIDRAYPFIETEATRRGNRLHKKMEDYFLKGGGLPYEFKNNEDKTNHALVALLRDQGARPEVKLGMTRDGRGCGFFDKKNVWLRGKIDLYLAIPSRHVAIMGDWKSGNPNYTDYLQADVYTAMITSSTRIEKVLFFWGYFSGEMPSTVVDGEKARTHVRRLINVIEEDETFAPTPCWKCRFCPVVECEYNTNDSA